MILGKKIVIVLPAYEAEQTLAETYKAIPHEIVDEIVLVDDASSDSTADLARELGIRTLCMNRIPAMVVIRNPVTGKL